MVASPSSSRMARLLQAQGEILDCTRCPRLVEYRERVAREKVRRFRDWEYWGRPVPSFGSLKNRLLVIGLPPPPPAGIRTGRGFTGGRPGAWRDWPRAAFGFGEHPRPPHAGAR